VVEDVEFDDAAGAVVVAVRPNAKARGRCGRCARRSPRYDNGEGRRWWRALDLGTTKVFLEADAPRVQCREHGPTVAAVPWARHGAGHTRDFDDLAAWLAVRTSKSAVCQLLRVAWRTVGSIVTRVNAEVDAVVDRLDGLRRIGIDEISYKRGHRYLIVVVDHDTTLEHGLSNARVESTNTKIRLLTRIAFGFHGHQPLIALALLALGSHPPRLPGR
jgi:transposase